MNKRKDNKLRINGVRVRDIRDPSQSKAAKVLRRKAKIKARIEAAKAAIEAASKATPETRVPEPDRILKLRATRKPTVRKSVVQKSARSS